MAKRLIDARKLQKLVKEFRDEASNATAKAVKHRRGRMYERTVD